MGNIISNPSVYTGDEKSKRKRLMEFLPYVSEDHQEELANIDGYYILGDKDMAEIDVVKTFGDNPGTVADLHELARNSQPVCFDGLKVISNKTVNTQLSMGHHLQMGKRDRNVYRLNLTYLRDMNVHPLTGMSAITIDSKSIIIHVFRGIPVGGCGGVGQSWWLLCRNESVPLQTPEMQELHDLRV